MFLCSTATGAGDGEFGSKLKRVYQLSGFADTVYCEAQLTVHEYDIVLDILVVNRTDATMTNVLVELYTHGDLKLVERPQTFSLGPNDSKHLRANIKVNNNLFGFCLLASPAAHLSSSSPHYW